MRITKTACIVLFLLLSVTFIPGVSDEPMDDITGLDLTENNELIDGSDPGPEIRTSMESRASSSRQNGVSWVDSFEDDTGIDLELTDQVRLGQEDIELDGAYELDHDIIGFWPFNEGTGTKAFDGSNNLNDGTLGSGGTGSNLPAWTEGKFRTALNFDGNDDYVEVPRLTDHEFSDVLSIEAWIKIGISSQSQPIIWKGDHTFEPFFLRVESNNTLFGYVRTGLIGDKIGRVFGGSLSIDTWHHVAMTYDSSVLRIYIDGLEAGSTNVNGRIYKDDESVYIGAEGSFQYMLNGSIDELALYNRSLSDLEVKDHYEKGLFRYYSDGILISRSISIPDNMYWDSIIINKTVPVDTSLVVTILNTTSNQPMKSFQNLSGKFIDISSIDPHQNKMLKLRASLFSNKLITPVLHDWFVNWTGNRSPTILDVSSDPQVFRNRSIQITGNLTDTEDSESDLVFQIKYRSPDDTTWQDSYLTAPVYVTDHWELSFTPPVESSTGVYTFKISCKDSFNAEYIYPDPFVIEVSNNKPQKPEISISPDAPRTTDDLQVNITKAYDVETSIDELEFWYRWYKDNMIVVELDNKSSVHASSTNQKEVWRCEVYSHDGEDISPVADAEVTIQSEPPDGPPGGDDESPDNGDKESNTYFWPGIIVIIIIIIILVVLFLLGGGRKRQEEAIDPAKPIPSQEINQNKY